MSSPLPVPLVSAWHVLRLCSVFETRRGDVAVDSARFDPVGGMQNHAACLSRCLDALGVRQTIVTARLAGAQGRDRLGDHGQVTRVGIRAPWFRQLWALAAIPAVLRPAAPVDVVHVHQGEDLAALPLALLAARVHRCPLVVTIHCSVRHTLRGRSLRARLLRLLGGQVEQSALRHAAAVVVLADRTARLLIDDGIPTERVHRIPSGFDPALFTSEVADQFPTLPRPRVAYVGRLAPQKRPEVLVQAFGLLQHFAHLLIIGDGPDRAQIERLAASSPAADRITLHGFVEHDAIPSVLGSIDLLVLPSAYEELGSVLVEAMAAGVPVVATHVGGIPEVVVTDETGLLVPPDDPAALAAAMECLLGDTALAKRMGSRARDRSAAWCWPVLAGRVAQVYETVLRLHGAR